MEIWWYLGSCSKLMWLSPRLDDWMTGRPIPAVSEPIQGGWRGGGQCETQAGSRLEGASARCVESGMKIMVFLREYIFRSKSLFHSTPEIR